MESKRNGKKGGKDASARLWTWGRLGRGCSPAPSLGQAYVTQYPGTIKTCYVVTLDLFGRARRYMNTYRATYSNGGMPLTLEKNRKKRNPVAEKEIVRGHPRDDKGNERQ